MTGKGPSLYESLGVDREASKAEIRKAYQRLALRLHPDKNPNDPEAKDRFQSLQKVYAILSDEEKRSVYDATGSVGEAEDVGSAAVDSLYKYYRTIYKEVTEEDIEAYEMKYRGSEAERADLLDMYERFNGKMSMVFAWLCCSRPDVDSHRFCDTLKAAISAGEVKGYKKFEKWAATTERKPQPKQDPLKPVGKSKKRHGGKGGDDMAGLALAIRNNGARRQESIISALEAKYGGKKKTKKTKDKIT